MAHDHLPQRWTINKTPLSSTLCHHNTSVNTCLSYKSLPMRLRGSMKIILSQIMLSTQFRLIYFVYFTTLEAK